MKLQELLSEEETDFLHDVARILETNGWAAAYDFREAGPGFQRGMARFPDEGLEASIELTMSGNNLTVRMSYVMPHVDLGSLIDTDDDDSEASALKAKLNQRKQKPKMGHSETVVSVGKANAKQIAYYVEGEVDSVYLNKMH